MLFFFLACSLTTTPIQVPQRESGLSDDMQAQLIMQVDNALNIAENDDSIERLYALRDLLSVLKIIDKEDAENLNRYVNQVISIEEKSTSQEFEIDLSFPDVSNDEVIDVEGQEDSLLVPLDAWNTVLNQLGNLHEASQQMAEARERAAKAEAEAEFLREKLKNTREQLDQVNKKRKFFFF